MMSILYFLFFENIFKGRSMFTSYFKKRKICEMFLSCPRKKRENSESPFTQGWGNYDAYKFQ